jgi:hypothetical protein
MAQSPRRAAVRSRNGGPADRRPTGYFWFFAPIPPPPPPPPPPTPPTPPPPPPPPPPRPPPPPPPPPPPHAEQRVSSSVQGGGTEERATETTGFFLRGALRPVEYNAHRHGHGDRRVPEVFQMRPPGRWRAPRTRPPFSAGVADTGQGSESLRPAAARPDPLRPRPAAANANALCLNGGRFSSAGLLARSRRRERAASAQATPLNGRHRSSSGSSQAETTSSSIVKVVDGRACGHGADSGSYSGALSNVEYTITVGRTNVERPGQDLCQTRADRSSSLAVQRPPFFRPSLRAACGKPCGCRRTGDRAGGVKAASPRLAQSAGRRARRWQADLRVKGGPFDEKEWGIISP